jgi:hypothetical protein
MHVHEFRWIDWNLEHATVHGCTIEEIEAVVRHPGRGYPRKIGDGKWIAEGRGIGGRMIRVIYLFGGDDRVFVIHAMPLTTRRRR